MNASKSLSPEFFLFVIISLVPAIFVACGPKPSVENAEINTPYNLKAIAGSNKVELIWQIERDKKSPISGYDIYLADSPNSPGELYNNTPYPGDTDGDINKESIEITNLENGKRYYAYVRTVFADGGLSGPSGKVSFVPLAQGKITITQNYTIDGSGYSFALQKYTKARDFENDIYIFATNSKTGISSPSRMHSSLRETRITLDGNTDLTQPLQNGKTYMLKTADGGLVRLTLLSLSGKPPELKATFNYIYYPPGVSPS